MESLEIYQKLKKLRKERGLTLNSFAEKIGSDYQQVSRIERGKSKLTIDMLTKMANALETPVSSLVESKAPLFPKSLPTVQPSAALQEELLPLIFGKIEMMLHKTGAEIPSNIKAEAASKIYEHALANYPKKEDARKFIDFSIDLMKTLLQNPL